MRIGDAVIAVGEVSESDFAKPGEEWIHALRGDQGEIVDLCEPGFVMVRWNRTGTASEVALCEITSVAAKKPRSAVAHPMAGFLRLVS